MSKRSPIYIIFLIIASLLISSCAGKDVGVLKIVSSLPMTGIARVQTAAVTNGMQLRVEQSRNSACNGKYKIIYESWDDAATAQGEWDAEVEKQNANNAVANKNIIAYLGTFNSGAAKVSMPILNQAGMIMVSPGNTYPGLTHKVEGVTETGEPEVYYPTGIRNYVRLVAADDLQGPVAVNFMASQGIKSVYILDDQEVYGQGLANAVSMAAQKKGITVVGTEGYDRKAANYSDLMKKISTSNNGAAPDAIFIGATVEANVAQLVKDKVAVMGDNQKVKVVGPDGIFTDGLITTAGNAAEGVFATMPGLALNDLGKSGKKFYADYEKRFGETNEPYAIIGYEAMNVTLSAIERICKAGGDPTNRTTVRDTVFATKEFDGVLGVWSFDSSGDITIPYFLVGQVQNGKFVQFGTFTP